MTISVYGMTVPIFTRMLTNLLAIMDKAEANATERKFDTLVLSNMRLAPDMIPFRGQVMIATDHVKGCISRLAGKEIPSWADTEETFPELRARIQKALDLLAATKPEDLEGGDERDVTLKLWRQGRHHARPDLSGRTGTAELLLPRHHGLRDPAPWRRACGQARLYRLSQLLRRGVVISARRRAAARIEGLRR